ncbi:predicted protein [Botrytis cinerea T4]|uniref:Uncharacterized protein n=1 Tax=Botryotinia fuckeliana (strain T4) TaxID=999810 RepID=G2Y5K6_BOTF4|nr:predicted protein [Botrytis cinerea T4]
MYQLNKTTKARAKDKQAPILQSVSQIMLSRYHYQTFFTSLFNWVSVVSDGRGHPNRELYDPLIYGISILFLPGLLEFKAHSRNIKWRMKRQ